MKTLKEHGQFIDTDCSIVLQGKTFTSGGAFICVNAKGKKSGLLYAYPKTNEVGNWNGSIKINAFYGKEYYSNMGDKRQSVYFTYEGIKFYGIYYKTNSDIVRCREVA